MKVRGPGEHFGILKVVTACQMATWREHGQSKKIRDGIYLQFK